MQHSNKKIRTVKSYVKRNRHLTPTRKHAKNALWNIYGLETSQKLLNLSQIFGNDNKVIIEIGFGMGDSFFEMAATQQNFNFIGIEVHEPGIGELLHKLQQSPLPNVRIFATDAVTVINESIPDNSIHQVILLFPDPWPKRRHIKRRIIQPEFVETVMRKLQQNGSFHIATDCANYAKHTVEIMKNFPQFHPKALTLDALAAKRSSPTKFEQRGKQLGHKIWDLFFEKK